MNRVIVGNRKFIIKIDGYKIVWNHTEEHNIIERATDRAGLNQHQLNLKIVHLYKHFIKNKKKFLEGLNFINFMISDFVFVLVYNKRKTSFYVKTILSKDMIKITDRKNENFVMIIS